MELSVSAVLLILGILALALLARFVRVPIADLRPKLDLAMGGALAALLLPTALAVVGGVPILGGILVLLLPLAVALLIAGASWWLYRAICENGAQPHGSSPPEPPRRGGLPDIRPPQQPAPRA